MATHRAQSGNLVFILGFFMVGVLLVAFVALNYSQIFTHQKQAQSAVDAAALAVASEIAKATVQTSFGPVGLIDDYQNASNTGGATGGASSKPVLGINTIMARARLDYVIAKDLGNSTMYYLAKADCKEAAAASSALNQVLIQVNNGGAHSFQYVDNSGNSRNVDLCQIAANAYNASGKRAASGKPVTASDITIQVGNLTGPDSNYVTNIPVPMPRDRDATLDSSAIGTMTFDPMKGPQKMYKANVPITIDNNSFVFSMVGDSPSIVNGPFQAGAATAGTSAVPVSSVVRITVNEQVKALATGKEGDVKSKVTEVACAMPGSRRAADTLASGILRLEFPQGIPRDNNGISFQSALALMNSSMLPESATAGTAADNTNKWNGLGYYFKAKGGPFPGNGDIVSSDVNGRPADNASVSLSFYVYDWLKNSYLTPNIKAVHDALGKDLRASTVGPGEIITYTDHGSVLIQPAYAKCAPNVTCNLWGGIFYLIPNSTTAMTGGTADKPVDPRSLKWFSSATRNQYVDQAFTFRMQATVPQQLGFADPTTMCHGFDADGNPTTTNCNPVYQLLDFREDLGHMMTFAVQTATAADNVATEVNPIIDKLTAEANAIASQESAVAAQMAACTTQACHDALVPTYQALANAYNAKIAEMTEPKRQKARAVAAYSNAYSATSMCDKIAANMKAVTSLGVEKVANTDKDKFPGGYIIAGNGFSPAGRAATETEIKGTGAVGTNQVSSASGSKNWCGGEPQSTALPAFVASSPTNLADKTLFHYCTPNVIPTSQMKNFRFIGNADGSVEVTTEDVVPNNWGKWLTGQTPGPNTSWEIPSGDFAQTTGISALLENQSQYQALNIFTEPHSPQDEHLFVVWSAMAQNNVRLESNAGDVRDPKTKGNKPDCARFDKHHPLGGVSDDQKNCNPEAVRFQITSPILYTDIPIPEIKFPDPPKGNLALAPLPPMPPPPPPPRSSH